jgi:hypothetical protein
VIEETGTVHFGIFVKGKRHGASHASAFRDVFSFDTEIRIVEL